MKKELMCDLLITALEGGSNYWYCLPDLSMVKRKPEEATSEAIFRTVWDGTHVPVYDAEEPEEKLGELTREGMLEANELLRKSHPEYYEFTIIEDYDADVADIWFQYAVMKEIVFG